MSDSAPLKCTQCEADLAPDSSSSLCPKCLLQIGFETQAGEAEKRTAGYQPTFIPPTVEELTPRFPHLDILEVLGHGGMGVVYKARQKELDRIVALKLLRPNISEDPGFAERFQREARALAKLNHVNIITVYDFGRQDGLFFFIMEYVDGCNLRNLQRDGNMEPHEALRLVPQVCSALQYAHDNGVVHRDIKPENILIDREGQIRIADFGLAKLAGVTDDAPLTGTWQVMGTPHYMAPEQFEKPNTVDHRADIYSLGVVIYELLTGELPLGRFRLPSEKVNVDVRMDEVVLRSLDKEPDRRYQHVTDVATAVEAASIESHGTERAKEWIRDKAASMGENSSKLAGRLQTSAQGIGGRMSQAAQWLGGKRSEIGSALMICAALELLVAVLPFPGSIFVSHDDRALLALMTAFASALAFLFGRRMRAGVPTGRLRRAALFCLIPWFTFPPFALLRVILVGLGLIATSRETNQATATDGDTAPDLIDHITAALRSLARATSLRLWLFTILGLAGWCALCALALGGVSLLWYGAQAPTTFHLTDSSARQVRPASLAYQYLEIDSSSNGDSRGLYPTRAMQERQAIWLHTRGDYPDPAWLKINLKEGNCQLAPYGTTQPEKLPLTRQTISDWMSQSGIDTESRLVSDEIDHLTDAIMLMYRTQGVCSELQSNDRVQFSSVAPGIVRILRDGHAMQNNLIPIGQLLDPQFFEGVSTELPRLVIRRVTWVDGLYFGVAVTIWLTGIVRIFIVLYRLLWQPATNPDGAAGAWAKSIWNRCSLTLVLESACAAAALAWCFRVLDVGWHDDMNFVDSPFLVTVGLVQGILTVLSILVGAMLFFGITGRPMLRRPGWWIGWAGSFLAIALLPISLLTFPTGLAGWIVLTNPRVKERFGISQNMPPTIVTQTESSDTETPDSDTPDTGSESREAVAECPGSDTAEDSA